MMRHSTIRLQLRLSLALGVVTTGLALGCTDPAPAASPVTSKPEKATPTKAPPPQKVGIPTAAEPSKPAQKIGPNALPPRVAALATSGSPQMKALIEKAKSQTADAAGKTWVEAAKLAEAAREVPSALDLYQLAQRAAPQYCAGYEGARSLVTEIGKPQIALMILSSEKDCTGANKTALQAEAKRLQELLVVDDHAHGKGKKGAPKGPPPRPPMQRK